MNRAYLHLFCGKMASGKSTLAASLAREPGSLLLSEDLLLTGLYPGQIHDVKSYALYSSRLKASLHDSMTQLLRLGVTLVLDFPANTRQQRQWLVSLAGEKRSMVRVHYLECSDALCLQRLARRAEAQPDRRQTDTQAMFSAMLRHFEAPCEQEGVPLIVHRPDEGAR